MAVLTWLGATAERSGAADAVSPLLGRWESVVRSAGGVGRVFEFRPDGSMTTWVVVMVELTYEVKGRLLLTSYRHPNSGSTETQVASFRLEGDTLIQKDPQYGGETKLTRKRAGGPQDAPIVGVWTTLHESGQTAFIKYAADGRMVYRLPLRADGGSWSVSGDELTLGLSPASRTTARYSAQGDRLVLIDGQGARTEYTRAEVLDYLP